MRRVFLDAFRSTRVLGVRRRHAPRFQKKKVSSEQIGQPFELQSAAGSPTTLHMPAGVMALAEAQAHTDELVVQMVRWQRSVYDPGSPIGPERQSIFRKVRRMPTANAEGQIESGGQAIGEVSPRRLLGHPARRIDDRSSAFAVGMRRGDRQTGRRSGCGARDRGGGGRRHADRGAASGRRRSVRHGRR